MKSIHFILRAFLTLPFLDCDLSQQSSFLSCFKTYEAFIFTRLSSVCICGNLATAILCLPISSRYFPFCVQLSASSSPSSHRRLFLRHSHFFHTAVICYERRRLAAPRSNTTRGHALLLCLVIARWELGNDFEPEHQLGPFVPKVILLLLKLPKKKNDGNLMSRSFEQQPQNNTLCSLLLRVFKTRDRSVIPTLMHQYNTTDRHVGRNNNHKVHSLAKTFSTITNRRTCRDTLTKMFIWYSSMKGRQS